MKQSKKNFAFLFNLIYNIKPEVIMTKWIEEKVNELNNIVDNIINSNLDLESKKKVLELIRKELMNYEIIELSIRNNTNHVNSK